MQENSELLNILEVMRKSGNLCGIILASKNGDLIREDLSNDFEKVITDLDNLTAMCATMFESSRGIAHNSNNQDISQIFAELADHNIIIKECNQEMIFIMIVTKSKNSYNLMVNFNDFVDKVNKIVKIE
ncbi:MAG: roadblock/LC7 domain-containing protein [Promethearchaeia archaeon]